MLLFFLVLSGLFDALIKACKLLAGAGVTRRNGVWLNGKDIPEYRPKCFGGLGLLQRAIYVVVLNTMEVYI